MTPNKSEQKLDLARIRARLADRQGPAYWRSLEELAETEEFLDYLHHEFPASADTLTDPVARRTFLQLMGASLALAGMAGCTTQPVERLVPYVRAPEEIIPGKPLFFATAFSLYGYGQGLLVESHEGRPTKVEGNPSHPASLGAAGAQAQASVLDLYDPDRVRVVTGSGRVRTWEQFEGALSDQLDALRMSGGRGFRILTGTVTSPALAAQVRAVLERFPQAEWHQYEAAGLHGARAGAQLAYGEILSPQLRLEQARVVLSLDSDFLLEGPEAVRSAKDFSRARRMDGPESSPSRLYMIESTPTITGAMAEHRRRARPGEVRLLAWQLARELGVAGTEVPAGDAWLKAAAEDLKAHRGSCLVVAGAHQPAEVHALAYAINDALGNLGRTLILTRSPEAAPVDQIESLARLSEDMAAGNVGTLLILGGNPVFDAPADLNFASALSKVGLRVHLTSDHNETSELSHWVLPESHYLEAWGDVRAHDGTVSIVQPLIEPLYPSRSALEMLATIAGRPGAGYDLVREFWRSQRSGPDFENFWRRTLHDGVMEGTALPSIEPRPAALPRFRPADPVEGLEVAFRPDPSILDGRFCNNGWLQELPKILTKLTWDNAALISPATAEEFSLSNGDVVQISLEGRSLEIPVWLQPGHPDGSVTLYYGYGRRKVGRVGQGTGTDVFPLRTRLSFFSGVGAKLNPTEESRQLASTQKHFLMEGRPLALSATLEEFRAHPHFAHEQAHEPEDSLNVYPDFEYKGYAWGLAVDLNACIGCGACVVACQAENNIPVVGRDQVSRGREMHWIRVDTYYSGTLESPDVVHQVVLCQQCEKAPCEVVCPVGATVHSDEGLNDMVYNRCVGTRYCSNNCPYKVRRFNFLLYSDWDTETTKLQKNPDVTVRSRGVMEKCTYCVQRINGARIQAELEDRRVRDGEIKTACQQTCPAEAIVFGDINDPHSEVVKWKSNPRNYTLLAELNTRPRTSYLARIRNANEGIERS